MDSLVELLTSLGPRSIMPFAVVMLLAGAAAVGWPLLADAGARSDVKRRLKVDTGLPVQKTEKPKKNPNAVREKAVRTAQEFYARSDPENVARLRMKLIQAGYFDPRAVGAFFLLRFGAFTGFAVISAIAEKFARGQASTTAHMTFILMAGALG